MDAQWWKGISPVGLLELSHLQATSPGIHLVLYHWLLALVSLGLSGAHG